MFFRGIHSIITGTYSFVSLFIVFSNREGVIISVASEFGG